MTQARALVSNILLCPCVQFTGRDCTKILNKSKSALVKDT
jgi:hypothetical protein